MVYRWSKNGRYLACTGYPECKTTAPVDARGQEGRAKGGGRGLPQVRHSDMLLRRSRFGAFLGCVKYPKCEGILPCDPDGNPLKVVKEEEVTGTCPKCGGTMVVRRKGRRTFLGCSKYPECDGTGPIPDGIRVAAPPKAPPKDAGLKCPKCGKPMVIRQGPRGEFVACSGFPRCRNSFNLNKLEEAQKAAKDGKDVQAVIGESKGGRTAKPRTTKKRAVKTEPPVEE